MTGLLTATAVVAAAVAVVTCRRIRDDIACFRLAVRLLDRDVRELEAAIDSLETDYHSIFSDED